MKLVTTLALAPKRFGCFFRQEEIELDFHPMRIENISIGQDFSCTLQQNVRFVYVPSK